MVMVLEAQLALTPAGSPVAVPMPVAPVVEIVMFGLRAVLMQTVGFVLAEPVVFNGLTIKLVIGDVGPVQPGKFWA